MEEIVENSHCRQKRRNVFQSESDVVDFNRAELSVVIESVTGLGE